MSSFMTQELTNDHAVVDIDGQDVTLTSLPGSLTGPLVWSGADFKSQDLFTLRLSTDNISEIEAALNTFKGTITVQIYH